MAKRVRPPARPVTMVLDGRAIVADAGETVACALVASGIRTIARSPKFHRPRGASCMRGGCDGCVVRINGIPNVLGCLEGCREGMQIQTQNRVGPRDFDLLRASDWFFASGMNHHELFIGVPGAEPFIRHFARRISGLGHLPDEPLAVVQGARRSVPVVVVGGGAAGIAAAVAFVDAGRRVELIDESISLDSSLTSHTGADETLAKTLLARVRAQEGEGRVVLRSGTRVVGVLSGLLLAESASGAEVIDAGLTILATGAHDGTPLFDGNDLPAVYSLRAARRLWASGVVPGEKMVIVVHEDASPSAHSLARSLAGDLATEGVSAALRVGRVVRAHGTSSVRKVTLKSADGAEETLDADTLIVEPVRAPSFELASQSGAPIARSAGGFAVASTFWGGRFAAIGQVTGAEPCVSAFASCAAQLVAQTADHAPFSRV